MFGLSKREKLEKQLMSEIRDLAGVVSFPLEDAKAISKLITVGYKRGDQDLINLGVMATHSTLEKYPNLLENWDELMIKYHKLGLFPNWHITPME